VTGSLLATLQYILGNWLPYQGGVRTNSPCSTHVCRNKLEVKFYWENREKTKEFIGIWKRPSAEYVTFLRLIATRVREEQLSHDGTRTQQSIWRSNRVFLDNWIDALSHSTFHQAFFAFMMPDGSHDNTGYHSITFLQTVETGIFDGAQVTRTSKYKKRNYRWFFSNSFIKFFFFANAHILHSVSLTMMIVNAYLTFSRFLQSRNLYRWLTNSCEKEFQNTGLKVLSVIIVVVVVVKTSSSSTRDPQA